ncbi:hypothetical protein BAUCODRAFT_144466 [Baudoinia panamericana UAMH 10762]|uniref:Uncharacterized protein n=1 Tax=Baudoinia panamericana (strain UAMH 10762) TaxID=717646 RepID=M2N9J6_BAUPA|nr:uncharacterized protein BAUCODRAFT_144466 [Baudoinia panamericana UAMH 10762]EMD00864.1 hypothetical protein BAUCODRAFT_144466 [Baudoinia panamericana UAMH 10762]
MASKLVVFAETDVLKAVELIDELPRSREVLVFEQLAPITKVGLTAEVELLEGGDAFDESGGTMANVVLDVALQIGLCIELTSSLAVSRPVGLNDGHSSLTGVPRAAIVF